MNLGNLNSWRICNCLLPEAVQILSGKETDSVSSQIGTGANYLNWDGVKETISVGSPAPTGPSLDLSNVMVPIHTKWGCYDSRGKIIRCSHVNQRDFHTNYFRRGSSKKWQDILKIQ